MATRRQPHEYNWEKLEFDEGLLLPSHPVRSSPRDRGVGVEFFVAHHMIITNREVAGRSANQRCYEIWVKEGREASAHYGVDGDYIDQFVYDSRAAWANGNRWANHRSIAVEHANATLDLPGTQNDYVIDEKTFVNGARLMGAGHNLFNLVPKRDVTVRKHSNFSATACPGPYMDRNWRRYFDTVHDFYNSYKTGKSLPAPEKPQHSVPQPGRLNIEQIAKEVINGIWGNGNDRIGRLTSSGYNAQHVQNKVNEILRGLKSVETIAREVIRGAWGNGTDRFARLNQAGYNAQEIQRKVNQLLS